MKGKRTLTTGEIADHCGVNFRTVIRWIKAGRLKAFQLPGRGDNRVEVPNFIDFLRRHQMPIPKDFAHLARRVLIVDDDVGMAKAIQRTLRRGGYETRIARDGFRAGALVTIFSPTAMVLDLQMPGLGGPDVIKFVRSQEHMRSVKILVVSAMPQAQLQETLKAGADDVLEKPFQNKVLLEKLAALTGSGPQ